MPEVQLAKFDGGVSRFSPNPELDKSINNSVAEAINLDYDEHGNSYVTNGYVELTSGAGYDSVRGVYYCYVLNKYIVMVGGGLIVHNAETFAVEHTHTSVVLDTGRPTWASWAPTSTLYISDGAGTFGKLTASGATWTDLSSSVPRGRGILMVYKNHLISAANLTDGATSVAPSNVLGPEAFDSANVLNFPAGGPRVTALSALNGVLHVHKLRTIWAVGGDTLSGTAKDLFRLDLELGSGAVHHNLVCTLGQITYYVAFNGIHAFNSKQENLVGNRLRQKLNKIYIRKESGTADFAFDDTDIVWMTPYCPAYGPESGRKFILICLKSAEMFSGVVFKYDPLKDTAVQLELGSPENYILAATYAPEKNSTVFIPSEATELVKFAPSISWGSRGDVEGRITTHLMDPAPGKSKNFSTMESTHLHATDVEYKVGYEGFAPSHSIQTDTTHNLMKLPEVSAYGMQVSIKRVGGNQPLATGLNFEVSANPGTESHSWEASKAFHSDYMQDNSPLYDVGTVTFTGGESGNVTVPHTLGQRPEFVMACVEGQLTDLYVLTRTFTGTSFQAELPVTVSAGDKLHYIAVAASFHTRTNGVVLGSLAFSALNTYHYQVHDFTHWLNDYSDSGACFLNKTDANNKQVQTYADDIQLGAQLPTGGTVGDRAQLAYFYRNGSDVSRWSIGQTAVNASSVDVLHGLGSTPRVVIAQFANTTAPGQGVGFKFSLTGITSTKFTLSRDSTNTLNVRWLAVK